MTRPCRRIGRTILLVGVVAICALLTAERATAQLRQAPVTDGRAEAADTPRARMPSIPEDARVDAPPAAAPSTEGGSAQPAPAGTPSEPQPGGEQASSTSPEGDPVAGDAQTLLRLLRDDAVRERLIAELEKVAPAPDGEAAPPAGRSPETPPHATPRPDPSEVSAASTTETESAMPLGRRIADITRSTVGDLARDSVTFWNGLKTTWRRLGGFQRLQYDRLLDVLFEIAPVLLICIGALPVLRFAALGPARWIGRKVIARRFIRSTMLAVALAALDAATVFLAMLAGSLVATIVMPPAGEVTLFQTLFLQAFLVAEGCCLVLRVLFRPRVPQLRILPMNDRTAAYWQRQLGGIVRLVAYGAMFVQPLVIETTSIFTGRASLVLILVLALIWILFLIFRHRKEPSAYFHGRAEAQGNDMTLNLIAWVFRYWHLFLLPYFGFLFYAAVTSSGSLRPVMIATGQILGGFALGAFLVAWITRVTANGISLPESINERLPMLERRLDAFIPAFLRILRFVILLIWIAYSFHVAGVFDVWGWAQSNLGIDVAGAGVSLALIVLGGFAVWLALNSWVDYRLAPRRGRYATSRERTLLTLLRNAASIAIGVITLMFALSEIGINIAPLLASAGVLGLAIGFGAQKMVQDIITGVFIQFENAINVGDVVTVGGTTGTVEKLTIRSVSLRDLHGVFHIIPFSSVDSVSNYMRGFAYHVADMGIAYREDIDEARALMLEAFENLRGDPEIGGKILGDLEWFGVQSLGDSAVVLRARIKTRPGEQWGIGRAYNERCKKLFDREGVEIPFPHMTVWFGEMKDGTAPPAHLILKERAASHSQLGGTPVSSGAEAGEAARPTQDEPLENDTSEGAGDEAPR